MHQPNTTLQGQDAGREKKKKENTGCKMQENAEHQKGTVLADLVGKHPAARGPGRDWTLRKWRA